MVINFGYALRRWVFLFGFGGFCFKWIFSGYNNSWEKINNSEMAEAAKLMTSSLVRREEFFESWDGRVDTLKVYEFKQKVPTDPLRYS